MLAWLDLTGCAFSLRPIHWFQYTSCPTFSQCYVTSKVLQFWWTICLDNSSANCNDHRSRNCPSSYTNSTTSFTFTRNSVDSGIIIFFFSFSNFFFQLFTDVLIKVYLGYFFPNFSNADLVPCIKAFWNWGVITEVECMILSRY